MSIQVIDTIEAVKEISLSPTALATLLDFERVIDELDVYAFKNWKEGEVVAGPEVEKYFVKVTLMWPRRLMPDPRGGEQLLNYNCLVTYKKDVIEYPIRIQQGEDFLPGTKLAKTKKAKIWLVEIIMPKQLMNDIAQGSIDIESETIDMQDIEDDEGEDQENKQTNQGGGMDPGMGGAGGMASPDGGGMSPLGGPPQQPGPMGGM